MNYLELNYYKLGAAALFIINGFVLVHTKPVDSIWFWLALVNIHCWWWEILSELGSHDDDVA